MARAKRKYKKPEVTLNVHMKALLSSLARRLNRIEENMA